MSEFDMKITGCTFNPMSTDYGTGYESGVKSQQSKIDELQGRIGIYELHIKALKNIHENQFDEKSDTSFILGNLDGFFECVEVDLKGKEDE